MRIPDYVIDLRFAHEDNLDDVVPSDKYRAEFGTGPVPITHVDHLFFRDGSYDQTQALFDTLAIFDESVKRLGRINARKVEDLINEYRVLKTRRTADMKAVQAPTTGSAADKLQRRLTQIVRELVATGLKLVPLRAVVSDWDFGEAFKFNNVTWDTFKRLDEACLKGESYYMAAARLGVITSQALAWWKARGWPYDEARDECTYWLMCHQDEFGPAVSRDVVFDAMRAKYPWSHFESRTIMNRAKDVRVGTRPIIEERDAWNQPW